MAARLHQGEGDQVITVVKKEQGFISVKASFSSQGMINGVNFQNYPLPLRGILLLQDVTSQTIFFI